MSGQGDLQRGALTRATWRFGLVGVMCAAAVVVLSPIVGASAQQPVAASSAPAPAMVADQALGPEIVSLRTRNSKTYSGQDGRFVTRLSSKSVHFKDAAGEWRDIDNGLAYELGTGDLVNQANDYTLRIPPDLGAGPVRIDHDKAWVSFALQGASATATASGAAARFAGAVGTTDVDYDAQSDAVKETITLHDASRDSFAFRLRAAPGLRASLTKDGGVDIVDAAGKTQFALPPPFAYDAPAPGEPPDVESRASYQLDADGAGWLLRLSVDPAWLANPSRRFPVTVDPTVNVLVPFLDCTISSVTPTTSDCASTRMLVGHTASGGEYRSIMRFGVDAQSAIPKDAVVLASRLALHESQSDVLTVTGIAAHRILDAWNSSATWTTNGGAAWTPGAPFDPQLIDTGPAGTGVAWRYLRLDPALTQGWLDGSTADNGLVVKGTDTTVNRVAFDTAEAADPALRPQLEISWEPRLGLQRQHTYESQQLSDRMKADVNVANGNLVLSNSDLQITGTGLDLGIARFYNSKSTRTGNLGYGWSMGTGRDVFLSFAAEGSATLYGPSGFAVPFTWLGSTYRSPTGIDATLTSNANGTFTLTFNQSNVRFDFAAASGGVSRLTGVRHRNDDAAITTDELRMSYDGSDRPASIADTQRRTVNFGFVGSGQGLDSITDVAGGRSLAYSRDGNGDLTQYTDAASRITRYTYNAQHNLTRITDPRGNATVLTYDAQDRVASLLRVTGGTAPNETGPKTLFDYTTGGTRTTRVTDPNGNVTTYVYDAQLRVTKVTDAKGHDVTTVYTANSDPDKITVNAASASPSVTDPQFKTDGTNNLAQVTTPTLGLHSLTYDAPTGGPLDFLPKTMTNAQGSVTTLGHDPAGNLTTISDSNTPSNTATLEYNQQAGGTCANTNGPKGTIRCAIDGNNHRTAYTYDAVSKGNLVQVTPPATTGGLTQLGETRMTYDPVSRIKTLRDGKTADAPAPPTRDLTYDALDRVTEITFAGGSEVDFTYDDNGNLTRRDDSVNGRSDYTYDKLNRMTRETHPGGRAVDYTYDANGNALTITDWVGGTARTSTYRYDATDQLRDVAEPGGSCTAATPTLCTTYQYDARDNRTQIGYPNGVIVTQAFDLQDKVTSIVAKKGATVLKSRTYDYHLNNRQTELRQRVTDEASNFTTYGYDGLDRLKTAEIRTASGTLVRNWTYTYDGASNRLAVNGSGVVDERYAYNEANQLCWRAPVSTPLTACGDQPAGQTRYTYDANGNETTRGLTYNIRNVTSGMTPPGGAAGALSYLGTDSDELITDAGATLNNNALGVAARTAAGTTTLYTRDTSGGLVAERVGTVTRYPLRDALGSTLALTDTAGAKIAGSDADYDPFGALTNTPTATSQIGFAGGYTPTAAGAMRLVHFGKRYYDPGLGRWTQQDTLDQPGDLREANRYLYVGADPLNLIDPAGMAKSCPPGQVRVSLVCGTIQEFNRERAALRRSLYRRAANAFDCLVGGLAFSDLFPLVRYAEVAGCALGAAASGQVR